MSVVKKHIMHLDWWSILFYVALILFGWINIYAATYDPDHAQIFDFSKRYGKQLIWIITALVLLAGILLFDSKSFAYLAYPLYGLSILSLLLVFVLGVKINGARSWIDLGFFRLQPAEFMKVFTALVIAKYMSRFRFSIEKPWELLNLSVFILVPIGLILLQNDTGSALVYFSFLLVLFREGLNSLIVILLFYFIALFFLILLFPKLIILISILILLYGIYVFMEHHRSYLWKVILVFLAFGSALFSFYYFYQNNEIPWFRIVFFASLISLVVFSIITFFNRRFRFFPLIALGIISIAFIFMVNYAYNNILEPHQQERIAVLLGLKDDPLGVGYNVHQSMISIGSGGFAGKGFLQGTQTKFNFVPEQSTDFIFCTIGEEWGFWGSTLFIALYLGFLIRIIILAEQQRSKFSRLYGYGVVSILLFHFMLNVGMTIGIMPVVGIPLPFISYGGSSLWSFTLLIGIFLRLDMNRDDIIR